MLTAPVKKAVARRDESEEETLGIGQALHTTSASPRGPKQQILTAGWTRHCAGHSTCSQTWKSLAFSHPLGLWSSVECFQDAPRPLPQAQVRCCQQHFTSIKTWSCPALAPPPPLVAIAQPAPQSCSPGASHGFLGFPDSLCTQRGPSGRPTCHPPPIKRQQTGPTTVRQMPPWIAH